MRPVSTPFARSALGAQAENQGVKEPAEKWSLCNSIQYACNKGEMEKMLI